MCVQTSDEINKVKMGDNGSKNGPIKIMESSYGNNQVCKVLRNTHSKCRRSCTYKPFDEIIYR